MMYGNPISGYMAAGARQAVILRGPPGAPDQVYLATLAPDERTMSGTFYALNTVKRIEISTTPKQVSPRLSPYVKRELRPETSLFHAVASPEG